MRYDRICGFESIFVGLSCKKSKILSDYNIKSLEDLYILIVFGNNDHESLFTKMKDVKFFNIFKNYYSSLGRYFDEVDWIKLLNLQYEIIIQSGGATTIGFLIMVSFFFNIHIIIKNKNKIDDFYDILKYNIKDPIDILIIESQFFEKQTRYHFEYIYIEDEKDIFDEITKKIDYTRYYARCAKCFAEAFEYQEPSDEELKMLHEYKESY